ncbi:MAG: DUF1553 domain-containing protein [Planctomycetaceae bacterium]|nr:DUF1553 domain-containing protein [Planctomycetaceae bacterium]
MPSVRSFTFLISVVASAFCHCASAQVRVLPADIHLSGPDMTQRVLAQQYNGETSTGPAVGVQLVSDDAGIAKIENGHVIPVSNGTTHLRAVAAGAEFPSMAAKVTVTGMDQQVNWSFRNHIEPILARQGCSSGPCHGALAGKGGFRISLRGYDPDRDYFNIVHQQRGRRVDLAQPAASLLLTKPSTAVPHKGGLRLPVESRDYQIVAEWVAQGAAGPQESDARLTELRIFPEQVQLQGDAQQPLVVQAVYSDGRMEDVTQWAKFSSSAEAVATVGEDGVVRVVGPGEGAITAWFSSQIVIARAIVPFAQTVRPEAYTHAGRRNFIDDVVLAQLRRLNLEPSPRCSDEVFVRRAFLDTIGTLPTELEVRQFLADGTADKRDRLIDNLLDRPEFVDYWTYRWSDLLLINGTELRPEAVKAYYTWIHQAVEQNLPWDQFARQVVTSKGSSLQNGATNFYALHQAPEDMAENVSQAFLGLSIGCARCHNHPLEKWTNDQYYGFANLFARVRAKGWGGDSRNGDGDRTLVTVSTGELVQPRTGRPQPPAPLDAAPIAFDADIDRREYLADWLTSPDNHLFARSITNRVWKNYFGVGLVEQVDDMRVSNPASNEELLDATAQFLVDQKFDLKTLMRTILQSETWQRSSEALPTNQHDQRYYSHYFPRRLMAEVLLDAVSAVTDVPTTFDQVMFPGHDVRKTDFYPAGTRAIQLYDSAVDSYFLQAFGRNQRRITCECERSDEPSLVQVLHLSNGTTVNGKLQVADNRIGRWLNGELTDQQIVEQLFLTGLSRFPSARELTEILDLLKDTPPDQRREVLEDIVWGLVSSREFIFNH